MREDDLPDEWTQHYGGFMSFGDEVVMAVCRNCFGVVVSDFFANHTEWHNIEDGAL